MSMHGIPQGVSTRPFELPAAPAPEIQEYKVGGKTPGTLVLVLVFLLAFVVYYFVNWKLLSFVWRIG